MAESANTTQDVKEIKESLGQEVVPAVTGKRSTILKDQQPKRRQKRVTAGGASLFEIAAAIREDPTLSPEEAIRKGKQEAKEREIEHRGGALRRGTQSFFKSALGHGLGGAVAGLFDTPAQKEHKQLAEVERKYEEGNKFKANFLKSLLGEKVGGLLAHATTMTSTKASAFEKYQELMRSREPEIQPKKPKEPKKPTVKKAKAPKSVTAAPIKPKSSPQREEAHKALMALGYNKAEATERLANAPENASVEDLIKHGLNPTVKQLSKAEAQTTVQAQMTAMANPESAQAEAFSTEVKEDNARIVKEQQEHNKRVEKDLKEIKDKLDQRGSGGLLDTLMSGLKKLFGGVFDVIKKIGPFMTAVRLFMKKAFGLLGNIGKGIAQIGGKGLQWLSSALGELGITGIAAGAGAAAITTAGVVAWDKGTGSVLHKAIKQIAEPMEKYGLDFEGVDKYGVGHYKLNGKDYTPDQLPEIYQNLLTAQMNPMQESIGVINKAKEYLQTHKKELALLQLQAKHPKPQSVKPMVKAPTLTATSVSKAFTQQRELADAKTNDINDNLAGVVASVISTGTVASLDAIESIKKMLPALAQPTNSDPGGVVVKLRNDESSQASYVAQIFDHPATFNGTGTL